MSNFVKVFILSVVFLVGCIGTRKAPPINDLNAAQLTSIFPIPITKEKIGYDTTRIKFYEWGDKTLFELPVIRHMSKLIENEYGQMTDTLIPMPSSSKFFYYLKGQGTGVFWDSLQSPQTWTANVDSFLRSSTLTNVAEIVEEQYAEARLISEDSFSKNQIRRKFISMKPRDLGLDTMFLIFNTKPKDFRFTFSKKIDSLNNAKLVRIDLLAQGLGDEKSGIIRLPIRITFGYSEIIPRDKNAIFDVMKKLDSLLPKVVRR